MERHFLFPLTHYFSKNGFERHIHLHLGTKGCFVCYTVTVLLIYPIFLQTLQSRMSFLRESCCHLCVHSLILILHILQIWLQPLSYQLSPNEAIPLQYACQTQNSYLISDSNVQLNNCPQTPTSNKFQTCSTLTQDERATEGVWLNSSISIRVATKAKIWRVFQALPSPFLPCVSLMLTLVLP